MKHTPPSGPNAANPSVGRGSRKSSAERATGDVSRSRGQSTTSTRRAPAVLTTGSANERQALEYAERYDWHVIPTSLKRPIGRLAPRGYSSATTDTDTIRSWYREEPDAGVGIACRKSGVLVLDVDDRHDGDHELHDLEQRHGQLPDTVRAITGNGQHIYFANPGGKTSWQVGDGIDVRDRAYVIAPRSLHTTGIRYEWDIGPDELPLAALPDDWRPLVARKNSNTTYRDDGPIAKGQRNSTLTQVAGWLRGTGLNAAEIETALEAVNLRRCRPPLLGSEIRKIAHSIGTRNQAPKWALDAPGYVAELAASGIPLTPTQRLVLMALCHRAKNDGHVVGGGWLERETGLTRQTISLAIQALEAQGLASVKRQHRRTNQIWLCLPASFGKTTARW